MFSVSNTTSGAVLFFLLLSSPETIIPCVMMLGYGEMTQATSHG